MKKTKAQLEKENAKLLKQLGLYKKAGKDIPKEKHNSVVSELLPQQYKDCPGPPKKTSMVIANEIMSKNTIELMHCLTHAHNIISKMDGEPNRDVLKDGMEFENSLHGMFDFNIYYQNELIKLAELINRKLSSITE